MKCVKRRQRAIQGVREVVETAANKMSAAPELNPGDWKWIECISAHIDGRWHSGDSDRRRGGGGGGMNSESVNEFEEDEEKEQQEERKRAVVCYQLTTGAFQPPSIIPLLRLRVLFSASHAAFWSRAKPAGCSAERPTTSLHHRHQEMDTIGRARLIPGWRE